LMTQGMVCHETYCLPGAGWLSPDEVSRDGAQMIARATGEPVIVGRSEKMSKSRKNVVDPEGMIDTYGADTARLFMLSDSPPDRDLEWTDAGIEGAWRFINRLWRLVDTAERAASEQMQPSSRPAIDGGDGERALRREMHRTIARVTDDLEKFGFNRAVARIREFTNAVAEFAPKTASETALRDEALATVVRLIGPMMPHLAEELWQRLGYSGLLVEEPWPAADPAMLVVARVKLGVQVNGKLRGTIELAKDAPEAEVQAAALALPTVAKAMAGKAPRNVIVVQNRIVNVVV
jgi:leucyl-tRNA synthetase